ncbi:carboxypeptidase-like regulatory domain-containing protein [Bryobacter aggregatus]|uniref:carboxypeptidase-like regulatory domain-containing protein n=1 Tax=Bryobacter aggregatus TaxID=360054 RepID=UPI0004E19641|nr:carboxypeptidase-like regulatory domain-containing protein [Bryobacter aggregatus]
MNGDLCSLRRIAAVVCVLLPMTVELGGAEADRQLRVIDAQSGDAIDGALVVFRFADGTAAEIRLDSEGILNLPKVPQSGCVSEVRRAGYLYFSNLGDACSHTVTTVPLLRSGVISGSVQLSSQRPAHGALVQVMRVDDFDLKTETLTHWSCDDEGKFRAYGLAPGRYRITASLPELGASLPVYYPGETEVSRAQEVELRPGQLLDGLQWTIPSFERASIVGIISNPVGKRVEMDLRASGGRAAVLHTRTAKVGVEFAFSDLAAGSYSLTFRESPEDWSSQGLADGSAARAAALVVETGTTTEVALLPTSRFQFDFIGEASCKRRGRLILDSTQAAWEDEPASYALTGAPLRTLRLPRSTYSVRLAGLELGCYLASPVEAHLASDLTLQLELRRGSATVSGKIVGSGQHVLLWKDGEALWTGRVESLDSEGRFAFVQLRGGRYRILAFTEFAEIANGVASAGQALEVVDDHVVNLSIGKGAQ